MPGVVDRQTSRPRKERLLTYVAGPLDYERSTGSPTGSSMVQGEKTQVVEDFHSLSAGWDVSSIGGGQQSHVCAEGNISLDRRQFQLFLAVSHPHCHPSWTLTASVSSSIASFRVCRCPRACSSQQCFTVGKHHDARVRQRATLRWMAACAMPLWMTLTTARMDQKQPSSGAAEAMATQAAGFGKRGRFTLGHD